MYSMELNLQIRDIRKSQGYTLAQLADMVGISTPHLSEVERGIKNINNHLLHRLSEALGVTPADLIQGSASDQLAQLDATLAKLSPEDREKVDNFAAALLAAQEAQEHKR